MKLAFLTTDNREPHRQYDNPVPWFGTAPEALLQGFAGLPDLEVHVISCTQRPMRSPEKLADNIYFHSLHVPKLGWMRTLYQGCIRATRRKLREIQPDIVHGQGTERDCSISAVHSGFPNVVTIHGNMAALARQFRAPIGSFAWLAGKLEDWTLPRTLGVLCNSAYTETQVRTRNHRTWCVPNPVRAAFFSHRVGVRASHAPPRFITVGTVTANKRPIEILEVFEKLRAKNHPFQVHFVGQVNPREPYAARFLQEIRRPDVAAYTTWSDFQEVDELIRSYDAADAAVHLPVQEAFGLVVAEALSRNLKFFGSRTGGVVDIATGIEGAELVNDAKGLEDAITQWLEQGAPRPVSADLTMLERYHPAVIARRHLEIYEEVLSQKTIG